MPGNLVHMGCNCCGGACGSCTCTSSTFCSIDIDLNQSLCGSSLDVTLTPAISPATFADEHFLTPGCQAVWQWNSAWCETGAFSGKIAAANFTPTDTTCPTDCVTIQYTISFRIRLESQYNLRYECSPSLNLFHSYQWSWRRQHKVSATVRTRTYSRDGSGECVSSSITTTTCNTDWTEAEACSISGVPIIGSGSITKSVSIGTACENIYNQVTLDTVIFNSISANKDRYSVGDILEPCGLDGYEHYQFYFGPEAADPCNFLFTAASYPSIKCGYPEFQHTGTGPTIPTLLPVKAKINAC